MRTARVALAWFAVFYGLDWMATVPPTVRLTSDAFGRENTGVIYGWIGASHQLGASMAAFGAGAIRTVTGDYSAAFWIAGTLCMFAASRSSPSAATHSVPHHGPNRRWRHRRRLLADRDDDSTGVTLPSFHAESGSGRDAIERADHARRRRRVGACDNVRFVIS